MLNDNAWVAWSTAQTCHLAPSSNSREHVQYQLLGRWKERRTHAFLLQIAPMRITLSHTLLHSWKRMMLVHHELAITCNLCNVNGMHSSKKPTWIGSACFAWLAAFIYYTTKGRQKPTLTGLAFFANLLATTFSCQPQPIVRRACLVFPPLKGPPPCLFKFADCCPIASMMIEYQWSIFTLRMPYSGTLRLRSRWSSGGGKSEVMTWGFGWWLWTTRITHRNSWKLNRFDGFSFERNWTSRPRKTPKPATHWGKTILSVYFIHLRSRFATQSHTKTHVQHRRHYFPMKSA